MVYDNLLWHQRANESEHSGVHIALFVKWCMQQGWASKVHLNREPNETQKLINGSVSALHYFKTYCHGTFSDKDLNAEGNRFVSRYYQDSYQYLMEYVELFGEEILNKPEDKHDFNLLTDYLNAKRDSQNVCRMARFQFNKPAEKGWLQKLTELVFCSHTDNSQSVVSVQVINV